PLLPPLFEHAPRTNAKQANNITAKTIFFILFPPFIYFPLIAMGQRDNVPSSRGNLDNNISFFSVKSHHNRQKEKNRCQKTAVQIFQIYKQCI
ncbi:MAG: hypothetical protein FWC57_01930, partial [Endomicrobia bacterium]|nr:hypothetical protein [Endomicrobiia bacterium]